MVAPTLLPIGNAGAATLPSLIGVSPWLVVVVFAEAALLGFFALERTANSASSCPSSARFA